MKHQIASILLASSYTLCITEVYAQDFSSVGKLAETAAKIICASKSYAGSLKNEPEPDIRLALTTLVTNTRDIGARNQTVKTETLKDFSKYISELNIRNSESCTLEITSKLLIFLLDMSEGTLTECPTHNPSETIEENVQMQSGWRSGGYNPSQWCNNATEIILLKNSDAQVQVVQSSETMRKKNWLGQVEYNYTCVLNVKKPIKHNSSSNINNSAQPFFCSKN